MFDTRTNIDNGDGGSITLYAVSNANVPILFQATESGITGTSVSAAAVAGLAAYYLGFPALSGNWNQGRVGHDMKEFLIDSAGIRTDNALDPSNPRNQLPPQESIKVPFNGWCTKGDSDTDSSKRNVHVRSPGVFSRRDFDGDIEFAKAQTEAIVEGKCLNIQPDTTPPPFIPGTCSFYLSYDFNTMGTAHGKTKMRVDGILDNDGNQLGGAFAPGTAGDVIWDGEVIKLTTGKLPNDVVIIVRKWGDDGKWRYRKNFDFQYGDDNWSLMNEVTSGGRCDEKVWKDAADNGNRFMTAHNCTFTC